MKIHVLAAVLGSIVVLLGGCKPMHERDGLDPVSAPEYAVSERGTTLTAVGGKERGICMLESLLSDPESASLITKNGAISDKQLKSALRFMGYGEQIASAFGASILGFGAGVAAGTPLAAFAVSLAVTSAGVIAYRVVKGNIEGEKAGPITVHALLGGLPTSPIVEYFHRSGRLTKVLSDKEEFEVTENRMRKLVEDLGSIFPDYPNQCDHLKKDLQRH